MSTRERIGANLRMRNRGHEEHGSKVTDAPQSNPSSETGNNLTSEEKRLRARRRFVKARRRFVKGGVGGAAAVILSVYQRPVSAGHKKKTKKKSGDKKMSVVCQINEDTRKVGASVCLSIGVKK